MPALAGRRLPFYHLCRGSRGLEISHLRRCIKLPGTIKRAFLQRKDGPNGVFVQLVVLLIFRLFGVATHDDACQENTHGKQKAIEKILCFHRFMF